MATLEDIGLRDGYAELGEVRLHYVEAGEGPLVVLLHGFPDFWWSWRMQIPALVEAGFRVVAPDMRGYNLSSRPVAVAAYDTDRLARDVRDLIRERSADRALLVGHDWGALVAWFATINHPEVVERLAILNAPHPRRLFNDWHPEQIARSWYVYFFQLPWLPERAVCRARWAYLRRGLEHDARPGAFTPQDISRYVEAWSQPGAAKAMIDYYRALGRQSPKRFQARIRPLQAPTLVIWGERDRYLRAARARPDRRDVPNLEGVVRLPEASHWVQHDEPQRVCDLLLDFFAGGARAPERS